MLAKINKLRPAHVALIIAIVGLSVFIIGLKNPFLGDDVSQIVNNVPVHSLRNVKLFFDGGTFYNGQGIAPLTGVYYRPLMTVVFATIFTFFNTHVLAYHLIQLILYIACAFIFYLFLRFSFKTLLALPLALIFLVHPLNSQVVYEIASTQDALFFLFGILALWLLLRFKSQKSLVLVVISLFLCLLSKETAVLFIAMALLYLFWFNRKRLLAFVLTMIVPFAFYLVLKVHAIGLFTNPRNSPIDGYSLAGRLMTAPSIAYLYLSKVLVPWRLASGYYFTYPYFSVRHVLIPLIVDLTVIGLFVYLGFVIRKRVSRGRLYTYIFFGIWSLIGLLALMQIVPLDMTACATWFYFSLAGILGMIGVLLTAFQKYFSPSTFLAVALLVILVFGVMSAERGPNWKSEYILARYDLHASSTDFNAYNSIADTYINEQNFKEALPYAQDAVNIYPTALTYLNLGTSLAGIGEYPQALTAYQSGIKIFKYNVIYENMGALTLFYGTPAANQKFLVSAVDKFSGDSVLWMYLAILEDRYYSNAGAKICITYAAKFGQVPSFIYNGIMNDKPFTIYIAGKTINVK